MKITKQMADDIYFEIEESSEELVDTLIKDIAKSYLGYSHVSEKLDDMEFETEFQEDFFDTEEMSSYNTMDITEDFARQFKLELKDPSNDITDFDSFRTLHENTNLSVEEFKTVLIKSEGFKDKAVTVLTD